MDDLPYDGELHESLLLVEAEQAIASGTAAMLALGARINLDFDPTTVAATLALQIALPVDDDDGYAFVRLLNSETLERIVEEASA